MNKLFIDDIRNPATNDFAIVRSAADAYEFMEAFGCPDFISFDHDLGESDAPTGFDVAKWMVDRDLDTGGKFIPANFDYYVHSANPVGAANITGLLDNYLAVRDVYDETTNPSN